MSVVDFNNGFLCGLLAQSLQGSKLTTLEGLKVIEAAYTTGRVRLPTGQYTSILTSTSSFMPKTGYVILGSFKIYGFEEVTWNSWPSIDLKVTIDNEVIYEGDLIRYIRSVENYNEARVFCYRNNFSMEVKPVSQSDQLELLLEKTMILKG